MAFDDHGQAGYESLGEAKVGLAELMALYNAVVVADRATLPADCTFRRTSGRISMTAHRLASGRAASCAVISGSKSPGSRSCRRISTTSLRRCS